LDITVTEVPDEVEEEAKTQENEVSVSIKKNPTT
jgi:hypothetical protein